MSAFSHNLTQLKDILPDDAALLGYLDGLFENTSIPFLTYYDFLPDKSISSKVFTRPEFYVLVTKAVRLLLDNGARPGYRQAHYFSGNKLEDLLLRTASIFVGTVPITINWQADLPSTIAYKINSTESKFVFVDSNTPNISGLEVSSEVKVIQCSDIYRREPLTQEDILSLVRTHAVRVCDIRCVIFTSGTTGHPKGVELAYSNYSTNMLTFQSFMELEDSTLEFDPVVVNPMHHTNSTSITDWALRRPNTHLSLVERYSTPYWSILMASVLNVSTEDLSTVCASDDCLEAALAVSAPAVRGRGQRRVVAPLVSRHIDFLESLADGPSPSASLGVRPELLRKCLSNAVLLLGSAPVGPSTVARLERYADSLPVVRFGSTETTLQVCGIPLSCSKEEVMRAFVAGWEHRWGAEGEPCQGFLIGREHAPHTEVRIVKSVARTDAEKFLQPCSEGEPGYIVTRGGHVMTGYVGQPEQTAKAVSADGWYLNLGDVGFWLSAANNSADGSVAKDLYWQSRDSQLLIRGGANYAFEQVRAELAAIVSSEFGLPATSFALAVCGLRLRSEHEDECCVMLELVGPAWTPAEGTGTGGGGGGASLYTPAKVEDIRANFLKVAKARATKGAKPDHFLVGAIPMVLSKGVVSVPELVKIFKAALGV